MTKAEAYEFLADLIEHDDRAVELGIWTKAKDALELLRPEGVAPYQSLPEQLRVEGRYEAAGTIKDGKVIWSERILP